MNPSIPFAVGCYTDGTPHFSNAEGEGLTLCSLEISTGRVTEEDLFPGIVNPSYLATGDDGRIYTVSECFTENGQVCAFEVRNRRLHLLWTASSVGRATCHVCVIPGAVVATSYHDGKLVVIDSSGSYLDIIHYKGCGPVAGRQASSHPHQAVVSPGGQWLLVPDLGADCIWKHRIHPRGIEHTPSNRTLLPPGTGPRHLVFHSGGHQIYLLGELDGSVHAGNWEETTSAIKWTSVTASTAAEPGEAHASAIRLHPLHPILFTANRSAHEIVVLSLADENKLDRMTTIPSGGKQPRDFAISPDGNWLVVACQASNFLVVHRLDPDTGLPTDTSSATYAHPSPTNIHFL